MKQAVRRVAYVHLQSPGDTPGLVARRPVTSAGVSFAAPAVARDQAKHVQRTLVTATALVALVAAARRRAREPVAVPDRAHQRSPSTEREPSATCPPGHCVASPPRTRPIQRTRGVPDPSAPCDRRPRAAASHALTHARRRSPTRPRSHRGDPHASTPAIPPTNPPGSHRDVHDLRRRVVVPGTPARAPPPRPGPTLCSAATIRADAAIAIASGTAGSPPRMSRHSLGPPSRRTYAITPSAIRPAVASTVPRRPPTVADRSLASIRCPTGHLEAPRRPPAIRRGLPVRGRTSPHCPHPTITITTDHSPRHHAHTIRKLNSRLAGRPA